MTALDRYIATLKAALPSRPWRPADPNPEPTVCTRGVWRRGTLEQCGAAFVSVTTDKYGVVRARCQEHQS